MMVRLVHNRTSTTVEIMATSTLGSNASLWMLYMYLIVCVHELGSLQAYVRETGSLSIHIPGLAPSFQRLRVCDRF